MIKISVVGNCQARPTAERLIRLSSLVEIIDVTIVHLAKDSDCDIHKRAYAESDYIIAQQVNDNYPCEFVRTSSLKKEYGSKVVTVINLYFSGYFPDWRYYRLPKQGTLKGPMGDYHCEAIYDCWIEGKSPTDAKNLINSLDYNLEKYRDAASTSLRELASRESNSDCKIVDFLEDQITKERMFFSFNHPKIVLIEKMLVSVCDKIGITATTTQYESIKENTNEPLGAFELPINIGFIKEYSPEFSQTQKIKGIATDKKGRPLAKQRNFLYNLDSLIEVFYRAYDTQMSDFK
ncbi:WcbI family polysaccharide biosynthesis putative acetyltransferase [Halioxenophilus aromaticivorans]|uniref:Polysaccharide biosynthesis enzyme WcbI domain-containing protein n=1 Tax=Halioxenophilus aromaticivorans TaxID=1306992 RepID=A0AAV3U075_9ALTE